MRLFILLLCVFSTNFLIAESPVTPLQFIKNNEWSFVENKGQLLNINHRVIEDVKYYSHAGGTNVYCKPGLISFVFTKFDNREIPRISESSGIQSNPRNNKLRNNLLSKFGKITTSNMDLIFAGSNQNADIIASDQQTYYENFYNTGEANHGIINVRTYKIITYRNIYPHIDMVLKAIPQGMEYSFLVHPGGKVKEIRLHWGGVNSSALIKNGGTRYVNQLGFINESAPKCLAEGVEVKCKVYRRSNCQSFKVENYDKTKDLLIDPELVWGTYFGGSDADLAQSVVCDGSGNVYITGETLSANAIATSGSYQTSNAGGTDDVFLAKFNNNGSIVWATYFGGPGNDAGYGISADSFGNICITGITNSSTGISTSTAWQTSYGGGKSDAFLAKFNNNGTIDWATYYGGSGDDQALGISTDATGNFYITGYTTSSNGITTSGAYQTSNAGGNDGFLAKFNSSGSLTIGTFFGGAGDDYPAGIHVDITGNILITGYSSSASGIATTGSYQSSNTRPGNTLGDAFLIKFLSSGIVSWGTYFGIDEYTQSTGVTTDESGNIYMAGITTSSGIATSGTYQTSIGKLQDGFLSKFGSSGNLIWSTYYGGDYNDELTTVCIDGTGNVCVAGNTNSSINIATAGSYQSSNKAGNLATFLAKFDETGNLIWGSYYGGPSGFSGSQGAYGVCTDNNGNAYIAGWTTVSTQIATSGSYQTQYGGLTDAFLAKFNVPNISGINNSTNSDLFDLNVYPNPFQNESTIQFTLYVPTCVMINLNDIDGKLIYKYSDKIYYAGVNELAINAKETGLLPGVYFINLVMNNQEINRKILEIR